MAMEADWSSDTNWTIASGSLRNCLTFQSSLSLVDDDEATTTSDSKSSPLILHPPSPDSDPCEIKINFPEKHELRQVYVRSTARVYEIYYASNLKSNSEYLCTVRCGVAVRDGEILRSNSVQEGASLPDKDLAGETTKSEDDWVEVKVVDSPVMDSQTKTGIDSNETTQDLFEATAEIDDANACISVTLRLLSLQNKDCIYVDEIYVFGDPVDSTDSESQESRNDNSSSSTLMAMFLPTLMQLSKTTGLNHPSAVRKEKQYVSEDDLKDTHSTDSVIKTQPKGKGSVTYREELMLKEVKGGWEGSSQPDTHSQVAKMESDHAAVPSQAFKMDSNCSVVPPKIAEMDKNHSAVPFQIAKKECNHNAVPSKIAIPESSHGNSLGDNVERALQQLVSRMDRIEEICLGFQEKMVMPINNIEARLQRVEQQLDTLTKKSRNSALPTCYRISAPDASCIESDTNSCDNSLYHTETRENESEKKYLYTEEPSLSPHDISDPANTTQLLPGLVVTAPEFPDGEDEEDNAPVQKMNSSNDKGKQSIDGEDEDNRHAMNSSNDKGNQSIDGEDEEDNAPGQEMSSNDKRKQSIDDALSSALANFLSSQSLQSPKNTKSLTVKAPEYLSEDEEDHVSNNEIVKNDPVHLTDSEKFSHIQVLASSNISLESGEKININSNDRYPEKTAQEAEEEGTFCSAEEGVKASILAEHNLRTDFNDNLEDDKIEKVDSQRSDVWSSNITEISNELLSNQIPSGHSITQEGPSARAEFTVPTEVPKIFHDNIIENVLGFRIPSSVVDFESPLLDVKFISQRSPVTEGFLESLLVETPETSSRDPSVKESSDDLVDKEQLKNNGDILVEVQSDLISVDDGEQVNPATNSHFAVDEDLCTSATAPASFTGDNLPEAHKRKRDQMSTPSLI